jgi:putative DNA primase/helicase
MNSGNLLAVARALRAKWPQREIIISGDNDQFRDGNPGVIKATEAAKAIDAKLAVPQFEDLSTKPTDFNDLAALERLDEVRRQLANASQRAAEEPNVEERIKESGITKVLADSICAEHFFAVDAGGNLHVFAHGVYVPHGNRTVKRCVKELSVQLKQTKKWSTHIANEVVAYISADAPDLWEHPTLDVINVANGLLNVKTRKLSAHSPKHFSPVQLPVKYDPAATCPRIDQFIREVFPEDTVDLAYEIPAWLMTPDISKQKAILFQGAGGNGKSAYLALLVAFLGKINTWSETLQKLEHNQFAGAGLVGKLANICADLPSTHLQGTSFFLRVTTGDRVTLERKNGQPFDIELYCRFIFSANHPPRSIDSSAAFFDRWIVVPFNKRFRGSREEIRREVLDRRLPRESELNGLLNKSLVALARLRKRNQFTVSESVRLAGQEFRNATDPFAVWLARNIVEHSDDFVVKGDLRKAYAMECHSSGRPELTDMAFTIALKRAMPDLKEAQRTVAKKIERVWLGIGLKRIVTIGANNSRRCAWFKFTHFTGFTGFSLLWTIPNGIRT